MDDIIQIGIAIVKLNKHAWTQEQLIHTVPDPLYFIPAKHTLGGACRMFVGCNASAILRVYRMRQFTLVVAVWLQRKKVLLHVLTTLARSMGFRPQKLYRLCSLSISALIIWGTLCLPIFLLLHRHPSSLSRSLTEHFCCLSQASVYVAFSLCLLLLLELFQGHFVPCIRHTFENSVLPLTKSALTTKTCKTPEMPLKRHVEKKTKKKDRFLVTLSRLAYQTQVKRETKTFGNMLQ